MFSFIRIASRELTRQVTKKTFSTIPLNSKIILCQSIIYKSNFPPCRFKSKKNKSKQQSSDSETQDESKDDIFDYIKDKSTKVLNVHTSSMRLDALLKSGLGLSRNKIEVLFYESKVRLNGEKVPKKSVIVNPGDEIDLIKDVSPTNPDFLLVARIEVISAESEEESIKVKLRRCKSLTIENYEGRNSWQP